jgi:DNA repair protein RadC
MILQFVSENTPSSAYATQEIKSDNHPKISLPSDTVTFFGGFFDRKKQEYFCVLNLDGSNQVISARIITIGLLNHTLVHPREVFRDAILDSAASIIAVHNHPSGSVEPSNQDLSITKQIKDAGDIIGIKLLDHIILTPHGGYSSMRERGDL